MKKLKLFLSCFAVFVMASFSLLGLIACSGDLNSSEPSKPSDSSNQTPTPVIETVTGTEAILFAQQYKQSQTFENYSLSLLGFDSSNDDVVTINGSYNYSIKSNVDYYQDTNGMITTFEKDGSSYKKTIYAASKEYSESIVNLSEYNNFNDSRYRLDTVIDNMFLNFESNFAGSAGLNSTKTKTVNSSTGNTYLENTVVLSVDSNVMKMVSKITINNNRIVLCEVNGYSDDTLITNMTYTYTYGTNDIEFDKTEYTKLPDNIGFATPAFWFTMS